MVASIEGTDEYEWMEGGQWLIHRVDVTIAGDRVQALELIGGTENEGDSWVTRAFDVSGTYDEMTLKRTSSGSFLLLGEGVRSTLTPAAEGDRMTALWEQETAPGAWIRWMDMTFSRLD